MKKELTLAQKILRISKAANRVSKSGTTEDGNSYATIGDVLDVVKPLMDRYQLILIPGELFAKTELIDGRIVNMSWTIRDAESGEFSSLVVPGSGDGIHAISQAVTVSRKKAMECLFNLRVEEVEAPTTEERTELAAAIGDKKVEQAKRRAANKAAKEVVIVTWPASHNGHYALFVGKAHIMEKHAFEYMNEIGKWSEKEMGWLVGFNAVDTVAIKLRNIFGCTTVTMGMGENGAPLQS